MLGLCLIAGRFGASPGEATLCIILPRSESRDINTYEQTSNSIILTTERIAVHHKKIEYLAVVGISSG